LVINFREVSSQDSLFSVQAWAINVQTHMYILYDEGKRLSGDGVLFQHLKNNLPSCEWSPHYKVFSPSIQKPSPF